jgi:hypothetical protein
MNWIKNSFIVIGNPLDMSHDCDNNIKVSLIKITSHSAVLL